MVQYSRMQYLNCSYLPNPNCPKPCLWVRGAGRGACIGAFLLRLVLLEETNNTQAPGQDTRRAPHSGRERSTRGTGTETGVGGGVGSGVLVWQRAGQVCYLGRGATGPAGVGN